MDKETVNEGDGACEGHEGDAKNGGGKSEDAKNGRSEDFETGKSEDAKNGKSEDSENGKSEDSKGGKWKQLVQMTDHNVGKEDICPDD